ncbi:MAG TPA: cupin domain-containing protein [Kofleriaceae bacterium]|nr:cupin domain-containing protein [Kofleriaceae bacterium]
MQRRPAVVIRKDQIRATEKTFIQRLQPNAVPFPAARMGRDAGLRNVGVSQGRLTKGQTSFAYHAHTLDEEWIFIVEGRGVCRIDGAEVALETGDFVAFPVPSVAHQLRNDDDRELVYLFGGDDHAVDILDYPDLDKRYVVEFDGKRAAFHALGPAEHPFERLSAGAAPWTVFGAKGWGSAITEAALALAGMPFVREEVNPREPGPSLGRLRAVNPLCELPTVVLPDRTVLTESAAIMLLLAERAPQAGLAPPPGDPQRAAFLRWLVWFVAALYPTFTYGDVPSRYVSNDGDELRRATDARAQQLWKQLEAHAGAPWFLGERTSALDLYIGVMTRWRPQRAWFAEHCPRVHAIARACDEHAALADVWKHNFS